MGLDLIIWMIAAALFAVIIFSFIGFIPGTDETSVLLPITLAVVLSGVPPIAVLSFFISAIITLNLTNSMPTALVGLPGGVMSSPMIEHSIYIKNEGRSAMIIKKIAASAVLGIVISVPVSLLIANLMVPLAPLIRPYASWLFIIGAIFLSLISKNKILSLLAVIPLAIMFQSLRHLYWGLGVVPLDKNITVSFFLGITIGPLIVSLFSLLNKKTLDESIVKDYNAITIPREDMENKTINPFKLLTKEEKKKAGIGSFISNFLFVLSPVGLTILLGNSLSNWEKDPYKKSVSTMTTMSSVIQATYISGIIIPLFAFGIPLSPVALGPGAALFNASPVLSLDNNIFHILSKFEFTVAVLIGSIIATIITYILITKFARKITSIILKYVPHESVLGLFIAFILLLAFMDAGLINIFGVLMIGLLSGSLNKLGVNYGVQFMALYAAPLIVELLSAVI
ncbi:MAG: tripartite tricarboxylate transporter permease [Bacilli bacterium]